MPDTITIPKATWERLCADVAAIKAILESRDARAMPDHPMTPTEFAAVIGKHEKTVRRWIERGRLRAIREGRTVLITPVAARKFLGYCADWDER